MNSLDKQYQSLLQDILDNGVKKEDRTGTGTLSVFGRQIRHKMSEGFPLLTTKKMYWRGIVTELLWFLRGDTNIKYLVDNDCHIWDGDAYEKYLNKFQYEAPYTKEQFINLMKLDNKWAKEHGELGPIYGKQWRAFNGYTKVPSGWNHGSVTSYKEVSKCDQIANLIRDLKTNPDSRRLMVTAWNPAELDQMTLPPCHYGFQVYTRELSRDERIQIYVNQYMGGIGKPAGFEDAKLATRNIPTRAISLMWNQRSVDTFLGLPFNIASYGLLLEIIAKEVNMVPEELIGNLGDTHLYLNHIEQAKVQIGRQMTWEEKVQWVMKNTDVELENLYITEEVYKSTTPKHTREPYALPKLTCKDEYWYLKDIDISFSEKIEKFNPDFFMMENYKSHPAIKAPLSN